MRLRSTPRRAATLLGVTALALLCGCVTVDATFKSITLEGSDRGRAFDVCADVVGRHWSGTKVRLDKEKGKIETDPIEDSVGGKAMREQCYVDVQDDQGRVVVSLLALMSQLSIDPTSARQTAWKVVGSDVKVEGLLLDEIAGAVLALEPDAKVVATTLPKAAGRR
jgi:hypothetical protein